MSHVQRNVTVTAVEERRIWICDHCAGEAESPSRSGIRVVGWVSLFHLTEEGVDVVKDFCGLDCVRRYVCQ